MGNRCNRTPPARITFRVGAPPPVPRRPASTFATAWTTAVLGMLIVATLATMWLGSRGHADNAPASTVSSVSTGTP